MSWAGYDPEPDAKAPGERVERAVRPSSTGVEVDSVLQVRRDLWAIEVTASPRDVDARASRRRVRHNVR